MKTLSNLKVGDPVWVFDINRREYTKVTAEQKAKGKLWGEIIWREHWVKVAVVGENRVSWFIGYDYSYKKIPKKGPMPHGYLLNEYELDEQEWVTNNAYRIGSVVGSLKDYNTLKKIVALLPKYDEK